MPNVILRLTERVADRIGVEPGNFVGVCLAIFSGLALMANGAVAKQLGGELHPFILVFLRSLIMATFLFPIFARNGYARIRPAGHGIMIVNGLVFTVATLGWFWALPRVPLDMVAAIGFTSQLYAILGAIIFLGEKSKPWRWAALSVGFIGAMIILRPGFTEMSAGVIVVVFTAVLYSTNRLIIKVIATRNNPAASVVWQAIWATVFSFPAALYVWTTPTFTQGLLILFIAGLAILSHYTLAWALRLSDVGAVEPTTFMRLVWGAMLGFLFFDEVPHLFTILGSAVVLGSIIYIARRERREGQQKLRVEK